MSEQKPSQQDYQREYEYHRVLQDHNREFDRLVDMVPEDNQRVKETIRGMFHTKPDKLLNPEKLLKLKDEDPDLFREVTGYYMDYLKKSLGLEI